MLKHLGNHTSQNKSNRSVYIEILSQQHLVSMESFTFPHLWKRHTVLVLISAGHSNSKISEMLKVTEQFVRTVRRELISSDYDYKGVAERKHHSR